MKTLFLLTTMEYLGITKDSINVPVVLIDDFSTTFLSEGVNFLGILGGVMACFSLYYAIITYKAQKQTELHTTNAPKSAQIGKLKDLPRHFYRNIVCASAIVLKYMDETNLDKDKKRINYPSESNVLKLRTLPDEIIYDIDEEEKSYKDRHEFKLLLRNFNIEVEVASEHFSRKNISNEAIIQDIDNLIFKQMYLVLKSYKIRHLLDKTDYPQIVAESLEEIIKEHFRKLKEGDKLNSNNINWHYVNKILKGNGHLDTYKKIIDRKEALMRSYNMIENFIKEKLDRPKNINGIILNIGEKDIMVNKKSFINHMATKTENAAIHEKNNSLSDFINKVSNIYTLDDFKSLYPNEKKNVEEIYNNISAYFDFINKDYWNFRDLLIVIVVMDCIIEIDKIGMVNFSSIPGQE